MASESRNPMPRRLFIAHLAAVAAGGFIRRSASAKPSDGSHTIDITRLKLHTSRPITAMKEFYAETIGFHVEQESAGAITFRAGRSTLTFEHAPGEGAFYHFAFNIPENQIESAHAWQEERGGPFIVPPEWLNDPGLPREVVAFRHWNAHSIFFWDPAGNAVEYIARHDLENAAEGGFSIGSILHISEIGLVVDDVPAAATRIKRSLGARTYVSASDSFEPVGDQHGLLLMMKRGRPMAFDQGGPRDVFPTEVSLNRATPARLGIEGYPYALLADRR